MHVADRAEVLKLVRVDDGSDRHDQPVTHLDRDHAQELARGVSQDGSRLAIHLHDPSHRPAGHSGPPPCRQRPDRMVATLKRPHDRRNLSAAVAVEHDVLGEHPLERLDVAAIDCR